MYALIQPGMQVKVIQAWQANYPDPLNLYAGELVTMGKQDEEWPGWIWCINQHGKGGWVPLSWLEIGEPGKSAWARRDYNAAELDILPGENLLILYIETGWGWAINMCGESGWVPLNHLALAAA